MKRVCKGSKKKKCDEEIVEEEDATRCDLCDEWYHLECQLSSQEAFNLLSKFQNSTGIIWICESCKNDLPKLREVREHDVTLLSRVEMLEEALTNQMKSIETQLRKNAEAKCSLKNEEILRKVDEGLAGLKHATDDMLIKCVAIMKDDTMEKAELCVSAVEKAEKAVKASVKMENDVLTAAISRNGADKTLYADIVKKLETKLDVPKSQPTAQIPLKEISGAVGNCFEKDRRKLNIVVHNIPEEDWNVPYTERTSRDATKVEKLCRDVFRLVVKADQAFRVGKGSNGRPRLLIIRLQDEATKWDILRMARELRNSDEYSNVYISPDLTPQEQQRDKALRDEVKRRRLNGEVVEIRRGRVVVRERDGTPISRASVAETATERPISLPGPSVSDGVPFERRPHPADNHSQE